MTFGMGGSDCTPAQNSPSWKPSRALYFKRRRNSITSIIHWTKETTVQAGNSNRHDYPRKITCKPSLIFIKLRLVSGINYHFISLSILRQPPDGLCNCRRLSCALKPIARRCIGRIHVVITASTITNFRIAVYPHT